MLLPFSIREVNDHLFGKELFIRLSVRVYRGHFVKFCVCPSFPIGIEGGLRDVIALIPDHCLSIYSITSMARTSLGP